VSGVGEESGWSRSVQAAHVTAAYRHASASAYPRAVRVGPSNLRRHRVYRRTVGSLVAKLFHGDLILQTDNFADVRWLGNPVWQSVLDLWTIQEVIYDLRPALLIETGTHRGGSALFYAHLLDAIDHGQIITIDITRLHELDHPRIRPLTGSSTAPEIVELVASAAREADGPVMAILDSDHSEAHVRRELEAYGPLVTPGSLLLAQDGIIDELFMFRAGRPGPLPAIRSFLRAHPDFTADDRLNTRFAASQHPCGWLRRRPGR
jgi:cephalosporin hydroxylase